jgi:putative transposase
MRDICKTKDVEIIKGHESKENVHVLVSVLPHLSVSRLVQSLKGRSFRKSLMKYNGLSRAFWSRHLWGVDIL